MSGPSKDRVICSIFRSSLTTVEGESDERDGATECFYSENFRCRQKVTMCQPGDGTNVDHGTCENFQLMVDLFSCRKRL